MDRGEKLDKLVQDTEELSDSASAFKKGTGKMKSQAMWKWIGLICLLICIILTVIAAIIIIIVFAVCGFPTFDRCTPKSQ